MWIWVDEKLIWKPETPARDPAGARISAGKSGRVAMSLPKTAAVRVNWEPVSCMPSPESPANLMVTRSSSSMGGAPRWSVSVVTVGGGLLLAMRLHHAVGRALAV